MCKYNIFKTPIFRVFLVFIALICAISFVIPGKTALASNTTSLNYIYSFQDEATGGIKEEMNDTPQQLQTDWAIMAFASTGYDPNTVAKGEKSIVDFASQGICSLSSATDIERKIIALESANINTQNISGCNLYEKLSDYINSATGQIGSNITSTVFGVLALSAQGKSIPASSINYIVNAQRSDGGWDSGWGTESNLTAQAIMALKASGYSGDAIDRARGYLKSVYASNSGVKYDENAWSTESDAFSDAFTLMAIYSLGELPTQTRWLNDDASVADDLNFFLYNSDGSYSFNKSSGKSAPVWTTSVVLIALNKKFLPVAKSSFTPYIIKPSPTPSATTTSTSATQKTTSAETSVTTSATSSPTTRSTTKKSAVSPQEAPLENPESTTEPQEESWQNTQTQEGKFSLDWRWIALILLLAFLAGVLIRYLQHRYIDEKE